jgi:copper oxidase (laccase) domain-containing protein
VVNAIELMVKHQSKVEDVRVVLGPAICKNCFEVGAEVAQRFEDENKKKGEGDKWFANLHGEIICQLSNVGIVPSNIKTSNVCTFENENCRSYRRDGEKTGRMYSFLGVKNGFH